MGAEPEVPAPPAGSPVGQPFNLAEWFGIIKGLQIEPKVISATDGSGTTFGLEYKYDREAKRSSLNDKTDISFSLHSEGVIGADNDVNYNHLLTHGLRFSVIDIFPREEIEDKERVAEAQALSQRINVKYFKPWQTLAEKENKTDEEKIQMSDLLKDAGTELAPFGEIKVGGPGGTQWFIEGERGRTKGFLNAIYDTVVKRRVVFLMADLNADAETDDRFDDIQLVGSLSVRAKFDLPFIDKPFEWLRPGGGPPKNFLNRKGGPYVWAGMGLVDPSNNDSRKDLADEDDVFPRAHFGLFYRTEIFSVDAQKAIGLEFTWRYYHEFNSPRGIRREGLDNTSYFRSTILFPANLFVEYTSGTLAIDVEGAETIMGGWRYNF